MREDMSRVIVERPRRGRGWENGSGRVKSRSLEDLPQRMPMSRLSDGRQGTKSLNENLAPLRRYLESQVGRPWDKVYSELAANLRVDSTVQQHVRDHVPDFVMIKPSHRDAPWGRLAQRGWPWRQGLYVDANDGLLKRTDQLPAVKAARRRKASEPRPEKLVKVLSRDRELRRIDGVWHEARVAPMPQAVYASLGADAVTGRWRYGRYLVTPPVQDLIAGPIPVGPNEDYRHEHAKFLKANPRRVYVVGLRRLKPGELKKHGVKNASKH